VRVSFAGLATDYTPDARLWHQTITPSCFPTPSTFPSPSSREAAQKRPMKLGCGCEPIAREHKYRCDYFIGAFAFSSSNQFSTRLMCETTGGAGRSAD
jgi:hypothetical protein